MSNAEILTGKKEEKSTAQVRAELQKYKEMMAAAYFTVCDIDPRKVELVKESTIKGDGIEVRFYYRLREEEDEVQEG